VCHEHENGKGHPDIFDCNAWCQGTNGTSWTGSCVTTDVSVGGQTHASASCACVPTAK
jgi:hypothetical protein